MPSDASNQSGQGDTGAGDKDTSLLGGAPAGSESSAGGAGDAAKGGDSLLGGAGDASKTGDQGDASKAKPEAKADDKAPVVPEKYEFKAPEGVTLDSTLIEKATPLFKELGLTQDAAQKLVDFQAAQQAEASKAFTAQVEQWKAEVKALPESDKVLGDAKLALNKLADPATQALIAGSWMGSHPGVIKLLASAGKLLREDPLHEGNASTGAGPRDAADVLFGDMFKKP